MHAVADGAVVVQRGKHLFHLVQHVFDADDVQESFLLTGKRRVGQVFGGGRGAHREAGLVIARAQRGKTLAHGLFKIRREGLGFDQRTNLCARFGQRPHVFGVERVEHGVDLVVQPVVGQKHAKRMRRGGKAGRHAHAFGPGGELRNHLAEAGVLAANGLDIAHAQVFKRHDQGGRIKEGGHKKTPGGLKTGGRPAARRPCALCHLVVLFGG